MDSYFDDGGCCIVHPDSSNIILTGGKGPITQTNWSFVVSYSTNGGSSWTRCNLSGTLSGWCYSLAAAHLPGSRVYAGGHVAGAGALYVSTDRGRTWSPTATSPADTVRQLVVHPNDERRVYAATTGGAFVSTDAGATWTDLRAGTRLMSICLLPGGPDTVVVAGDSGVAISYDAGSRWAAINQGLETRRVNCIEFTSQDGLCLVAGTEGGACYAWQLPTGIGSTRQHGRHTAAVLPNPFVGAARVAVGEREEFDVHDHAGRLVGRFRGNRIGTGLPAGVYFVSRSGFAPARVVKTR